MQLGRQQGIDWSALLSKCGTSRRVHRSLSPYRAQRNGGGHLDSTLRMQQWRCLSELPAGSLVSAHLTSYVLQPCQAKVRCLAQVLFGKLGTRHEIGVPVAVTMPSGFPARGIAAALAH